ncbi:MAG TPA: AMP-binding protein, partial [Chroococcales cyanobacterium]
MKIYGEREALVAFAKEGSRTWTYRMLHRAILSGAERLRKAGVKKGDRVLISGPNSPQWIAACLSIIALGAVVVPLDSQLDAETAGFILNDSTATIAIAASTVLPQLPVALEKGIRFIELAQFDAPEKEGAFSLDAESTGDDIAAVFYTSGTTGTPKAVPLTHGNIAYQVNQLFHSDLTVPRDRVLLPLPLHHIYPFSMGMLLPLALGLPIMFPSDLSGPQLLRALKEGKTTILFGVPRLFSALASAIDNKIGALSNKKKQLLDISLNASRALLELGGPQIGKNLLSPLHKQISPDLRLLTCGGAHL